MSTERNVKLISAGGTHKGEVRKTNQDAYYVWVSDYGVVPPRGLLLVADGMGGHQKGEVASQMAVDTTRDLLKPQLEADKVNSEGMKESIVEAVKTANSRINNYALEEGIDPQNIGTTIECVVLAGSLAITAHVGDSRIYRLSKNGLEKITRDHSAVAEMVEAGLLEPEDIYTHPQRNVLTQGLGGDINIEVDSIKFEMSIGERLLLCSDGLWGLVRDGEIEKMLLQAASPEQLVEDFIAAANQAGGDDNISVVICDIMPG